MEDGRSIDVSFLASSSSGFRTDKWWRCTNVYHEGWFLPCYNDTSWPRSYVSSNIEKYFIAPEAKWIGYVGKSNKIYCRRYITIGKAKSLIPHHSIDELQNGLVDSLLLKK